jgi:uncharacterized protein YjbI with pentapeptide repeats
LSRRNFLGRNCRGAIFWGAIVEAQFFGAQLSGRNFFERNFSGAQFFRGAIFWGAIVGAQFFRAQKSGKLCSTIQGDCLYLNFNLFSKCVSFLDLFRKTKYTFNTF